jgi:hypothetical protein
MFLKINEAHDLIVKSIMTTSYSADEASIIADHLIDSELRGLSFAGVARAITVIERIKKLQHDRREIQVTHPSLVSAKIDGGEQSGYIVALKATQIAIDKAKQYGFAVVGASKTWLTGMFSYYLEMAAKENLIGLMAGSGLPHVAPHGGREGRFSTNPFAIGFPSMDDPIIWDIGTSNLMLGEVIIKSRMGEALEEGMAFDQFGQPTTDPAAALSGALTVWGGHRGSGLALSAQLFGILAGHEPQSLSAHEGGFFVILFSPDLLTTVADFKLQVSQYAHSIRSTKPVNANNPVRVPFERSISQRRLNQQANSIQVTDEVFHKLQGIIDQSN